jgi:hypothetical protein
MAPGQITQEVYARGLPEGVKLLITDVSFKVPSGDWWPTFSTMNHTFTKNDTVSTLARKHHQAADSRDRMT